MTITHHPDGATLMSFAAGSLPEALAAVVAAHIGMCPGCGAEVRRLEEIGASLLEGLPPAGMTAASRFAGGEADVNGAAAPGSFPPRWHPADLARLDFGRLAWTRWGPGLWRHALPLSAQARGSLELIKVAPGRPIPAHGHGGAELVLVLEGAYTDELGCFRAGDLADLNEDVEHRPVADPAAGCICLVGAERPVRFKSTGPRLLQFFGFGRR